MLFMGIKEGTENMRSKATCKLQSMCKLLFLGTVNFAQIQISSEARMTLQDCPK